MVHKLPFAGSKAKFKVGDLVFLPTMFGGAIYEGVVIGRGTDKYGEHQKVKVLHSHSDWHKAGEITKVRLMDLGMLTKFGEMPKKEIKKITPKTLKRFQKLWGEK